MTKDERDEDLARLRWMQRVSLLEGGTLLLLLLVGMPLKHFAGMPQAISVIGPVHGMSFLLYIWMLIRMVSGGGWRLIDTIRMLTVAFIPFGAILNSAVLNRRIAALAAAT